MPRLPAFDVASDQAVLEGQRRALRQEGIDAARIGLEHRARFTRQAGEVALRSARDVEPRASVSAATPALPSHSAQRPSMRRRAASICQRRSWPWT